MLTLSISPLVSTSHPVALKTSPSVDRTVSMHSRFLTLHAFGIVQIMSLTPLPSVRYGHYSYSGWELYLFFTQDCASPNCPMGLNLPCTCVLCTCISTPSGECMSLNHRLPDYLRWEPNRRVKVNEGLRKVLKQKMKTFEKKYRIIKRKQEEEITQKQKENDVAVKKRQKLYMKRLAWGIKQQQKQNINPRAMRHPWSMPSSNHHLLQLY